MNACKLYAHAATTYKLKRTPLQSPNADVKLIPHLLPLIYESITKRPTIQCILTIENQTVLNEVASYKYLFDCLFVVDPFLCNYKINNYNFVLSSPFTLL